ncbi:MAG: L,D-transpeptidase/peptidoglycan binding protein [Clostridium sp.]|nr:L,D-transpeptidase/peptidoglycan binding protein [Clostridium sp.]
MTKLRQAVRSLVAVAVLSAVFCATALADDAAQFVPGTSINGLGIGGMTVEQAKSSIEGFYDSSYQLEIKKKDGTKEYIKGAEIGYKVTLPAGLDEILAQQNATGRVSGPAADNSHTMAMTAVYDAQALDAKIAALPCLSGSGIVETRDARISDYAAETEFTIIPEVEGNNLDPERTAAAIRETVAAGAKELDLTAAGLYHQIQVRANDAGLQALRDTMNRYRGMSVTYQFGEASEVLDGGTICSWLSVGADGQVNVDAAGVTGFVQALAAKYDTAGTERTFHTADGRDVQLTGPYGWKLDQAAEIQALTDLLKSTDSQTREPVFAQTAAGRAEPEWGSTYVEIDLTNQHVYMTKDGEVVWDAPCVTGNVSKNYTTPPGIYSLTYKEEDRILRGPKKADGSYEYESHVDFWMPFNGGIGLHDANWRGSFGGAIFQTSGSHGCVNLPPDRAKILYGLVEKGMPVICYN